jgi:hypothetical protein
VELTNIFATGVSWLVGVNSNYGDTATLSNITRCGTVNTLCETFTGNNSGAGPPALVSYGASGGDGKSCIYTAAEILK